MIPVEDLLSTPLVVIAPQELGDFEFDGFLEHELGTQADAFRQGRLPCGRTEELFFEGLAGKLAFHDVARFLVYWRRWSLHPVGFYRKLRTSPGPPEGGTTNLTVPGHLGGPAFVVPDTPAVHAVQA
jgi:hypothetical protein